VSGRPQTILRNRAALTALMAGRHTTVSLAAEVGVSKQYIAYLCNGSRPSCSRDTAEKIEKALGCAPGTLFSPRLEEEASNNGEEEEVLHTVADAAKRLRVSRSHAYRLIGRGELEAVDVSLPGSRKPKTRVPEASIHQYISRKSRKTGARS
jgi:excisionase family DNA binding protein